MATLDIVGYLVLNPRADRNGLGVQSANPIIVSTTASAILIGDPTITITGSMTGIGVGSYLQIGTEIVEVRFVAGSVLSVARGALTSSAAAHGGTPAVKSIATTINEGGAFLAADTTLTVTSALGIVPNQSYLRIDSGGTTEYLFVTGVSGADLTVVRGALNSIVPSSTPDTTAVTVVTNRGIYLPMVTGSTFREGPALTPTPAAVGLIEPVNFGVGAVQPVLQVRTYGFSDWFHVENLRKMLGLGGDVYRSTTTGFYRNGIGSILFKFAGERAIQYPDAKVDNFTLTWGMGGNVIDISMTVYPIGVNYAEVRGLKSAIAIDSPLTSGATTVHTLADISAGITPYQTYIKVVSTAGTEWMLVTVASGTTLTVIRGQNNSQAVAHLLGDAVYVEPVVCQPGDAGWPELGYYGAAAGGSAFPGPNAGSGLPWQTQGVKYTSPSLANVFGGSIAINARLQPDLTTPFVNSAAVGRAVTGNRGVNGRIYPRDYWNNMLEATLELTQTDDQTLVFNAETENDIDWSNILETDSSAINAPRPWVPFPTAKFSFQSPAQVPTTGLPKDNLVVFSMSMLAPDHERTVRMGVAQVRRTYRNMRSSNSVDSVAVAKT